MTNKEKSVTSEQNSGGFLKRSGRIFLTNFQPDTFNNSYVNRAYIDAGINPTIVNTLLKNPSAIDTMKIPDYEKKYLRNLLNIPLNLNTDSINLAKNTYTPGDPTSFVKNSYAEYLKSTNKPDTLKLSDNSTGSGGIGVFDTPDNYTPITPNNSMLPHNELNRQFSAFNSSQDTQEQGESVNLDRGTDTSTSTKNPIKDSIKKTVNQNAKKDTGSAKVDVNPETIQPVLTPEEIGNYYATQGAKKSVPNPKTALNESQSDYYRYLTGYKRMNPNQAISSMGLDPNKYYYQHDPAYYH